MARRRIPYLLLLIGLLQLFITLTTPLAHAQPGTRFDHFTTGFRLDGAHARASCDSCHAGGSFVGTPTQCVSCHSRAGPVRASAQPSTHILTTESCESCHRPYTWVPPARVDHLEVIGSCSSCHDGRRAMTKPVDHLPAGNACDDCHRTTAWVPANFDHGGIVAGCFGCHDGVTAVGKAPNHIPATNVCEDCHRTISFSPARRVDHFQVLGSCSSCHNGVIATGQHPQHIPTTAECDSCHTTNRWR